MERPGYGVGGGEGYGLIGIWGSPCLWEGPMSSTVSNSQRDFAKISTGKDRQ